MADPKTGGALAVPLPDGVAAELLEGSEIETFTRELDGGAVVVLLVARPDELKTYEDGQRLFMDQMRALREFSNTGERADAKCTSEGN